MSLKNEHLTSTFHRLPLWLTQAFLNHSTIAKETINKKYSSLTLKCLYSVNYPPHDTKMEYSDY